MRVASLSPPAPRPAVAGLDLLIANTTSYEARSQSSSESWAHAGFTNGLKPASNGTFGRIALRAPVAGGPGIAHVGLRFTFLDAGPDVPPRPHTLSPTRWPLSPTSASLSVAGGC